jgi:hypothetical protein
LNIINNISKSIDFFVIVFLECPESAMFFLVFRFLISTKVRINSRTNNIPSLSRSFYWTTWTNNYRYNRWYNNFDIAIDGLNRFHEFRKVFFLDIWVIILLDSVCYKSFDIKPEILVLVVLEDNLGRFGSKHIASSSIVISLIVSLLVGSFNIFLIIFIMKKEY